MDLRKLLLSHILYENTLILRLYVPKPLLVPLLPLSCLDGIIDSPFFL